jgi:hypothetical protein
VNCQRNLPSYGRWQKEFKEQGVLVIGIHTPETEDEKKVDNVRDALKERDITYPVLIDGDGQNWKRWQQQWWPTAYLIDKQGVGRYRWAGELDWKGAGGEAKMARKIRLLLKEPA